MKIKTVFKKLVNKEKYTKKDNNDNLYKHQQMFFAPEDCTSIYGFGFGQSGWHYLAKTAKQVIENPGLCYEESALKKYYEKFHPGSMCEIFSVNKEDEKYNWLIKYDDPENAPMPWTTQRRVETNNFFKKKGDYGPKDSAYLKKRFEKIKDLVNSIKEKGYKPEQYSNSTDHIRGLLLKNKSTYKFLVIGGNHRAAVLAAFNYKIAAEFHRSYPNIVDIDNVNLWPCVSYGIYPVNVAEYLFLKYFEETGREKAKEWEIM